MPCLTEAIATVGAVLQYGGMHAPRIAWFSMELALSAAIPTYAGGLGVLSGDVLRAAADLNVPVAGVTLLYRQGYFRQHFDGGGWQQESPVEWRIEQQLERIETTVEVEVEGRPVRVGAWQRLVPGAAGGAVVAYFLDTDLPVNTSEDRALTGVLYGGDARYRLGQEVILGIGGVRLLRALGHPIERFHLNEGHSALIGVELLAEWARSHGSGRTGEGLESVRRRCCFTTHTPVAAGHDVFPEELAVRVLGQGARDRLRQFGQVGELNMSGLALNCSGFVNAVSASHGRTTRALHPGRRIHAITNGVHAVTWATDPVRNLFDRHLPDWRRDHCALRHACQIPVAELLAAHAEAKTALLHLVRERTGEVLPVEYATIGFARRATGYKRAGLLFHDVERLCAIARLHGGLNLIFAGKAHPRDTEGKEILQRVLALRSKLGSEVHLVWIPDYDLEVGRAICGGVDVWLNTPIPPLEASGTSGMKAALNGVPNLSVLDGWWLEGHLEGVTGWSIGADLSPFAEGRPEVRDDRHAAEMYEKLNQLVLPLLRAGGEQMGLMRRAAIAQLAPVFSAHRVVLEYQSLAWQQVNDS